jgi:hypothetical protein
MTSIAETMEMIADGTEPMDDETKEVTDLSSRYVCYFFLGIDAYWVLSLIALFCCHSFFT